MIFFIYLGINLFLYLKLPVIVETVIFFPKVLSFLMVFDITIFDRVHIHIQIIISMNV